ncbi:MAG TPA: alpha/beta hydrolase [Gammaproteobacteria bacterium]|jgi:lysophospholipase|nr:alpha/beta hydrolase [Gammaproteobacteria bacterium]HIK72698.1 alpha/beta hydrolase [Gammaproteobacteria bacterium]
MIDKKHAKASLTEIRGYQPPDGGESFYYQVENGVNLRVAIWNKSSDKGTILLQSGRTEFIEKYYEVIQEFIQRGFCIALMDWRGQGLSDRISKDVHLGHVKDFSDYDSDFINVIEKVYEDLCPKPWIAMGHSMGGCLVASAAAKNTELFDAVILCAPMLSLQMPSFAKKSLSVVGLIAKIGFGEKALERPQWHEKKGWHQRPFEENNVTSDEARYERSEKLIRKDENLAIGGLSISWAYEALKRTKEMNSPGWIKNIRQPVLLLNATKDKLVNPNENLKICSQSDKVVIANIKSEHEILMETDFIRQQAWEAIDKFIEENL